MGTQLCCTALWPAHHARNGLAGRATALEPCALRTWRVPLQLRSCNLPRVRSSSSGMLRLTVTRAEADNGGPKTPVKKSAPSQEARLRAEATSSFRTFRLFLYGAFIASAGLGTLVALTRLAAGLAGVPTASPVNETLQNIGIDLAALGLFVALFRTESTAQSALETQFMREEDLGNLRLELGNKRVIAVKDLRGLSRVVIVAGPQSHVEEAMRRGQALEQDLLDRGVLAVPFITDSQPGGSERAVESEVLESVEANKRFLARPLYKNEWMVWLNQQLASAKLENGIPVYISLRLDGRVRGSGVGFPPWSRFIAQLAPLKGMWKGPLDGFDGPINF